MKLIGKIAEKPKLRDAVLIGGVPDAGYVGKLVMDHIITELRANRFGEIYSYGFPPQVIIQPDGSAHLPKGQLFYWRRPDTNGPDLIMFTADSQPASPQACYHLADRVVRLAKSMGAQTVYSVGACITEASIEVPKVFGTVTDVKLLKELEKFGINSMHTGSVTWMNGLLLGMAELRGLNGFFISGETSGQVADARAAKAIVETLSRILDLQIDVSKLEEKVEEARRLEGETELGPQSEQKTQRYVS